MFFPVPDFKGFDFLPHNLRLPFMRFKGICLALSIIAMAISLGLYFTRGLNYGVDFKGGSLIEVQHKGGPADLADMREKLNNVGIGNVQIQSFGADSDVLIRVEEQPGGDAAQQVAMKNVVDTLGPEYTQRRIEVVGPQTTFKLDGTTLLTTTNSSHPTGQFGIGFQEQFTTNANLKGTRADNFSAAVLGGPSAVRDWNMY